MADHPAPDAAFPVPYRHPSGVACIDIARHMSFCLGNAVRCVWHGWRASTHDGTADLQQAVFYIHEWLGMEVRPRMPLSRLITDAVQRFAAVDEDARFSTIIRDLCRADFTHGNENAARHALSLITAEMEQRREAQARPDKEKV
ncbi:hypothetical protein K6L44_04090 [Gluconacetobacter entanii]|uniref:hypothetical protein n=1 Tax=Gluconacetobacter entanii TaxID=108528 RepID=UPI001ABEF074|nr:hypothetical protein [Gluconacetobacter entanii]MCE2578606.1 hypothetical protein [Komagataeibacter sp. FNDCR1]MBY4639196.1 hypothetical protein [Gluconacetobacter entanii]MCW4581503.1 hypothetical protein [Gluconacetobacter entanii]MCW4584883.1 hypothetical protein [Gluconacetobacter entanii]MCW4588296.1 hypothetical protein [Gluconacetobacter entanii]